MSCPGCSCGVSADGKVAGCRSNGSCLNGGCNRLNTFDWLTRFGIDDVEPCDIVEVSFKNGARKNYYRNPLRKRITTGDWVVVEAQNGYDIGQVSLSGELVRLQLRKRKLREAHVQARVIRKAHERDLEKLRHARELEKPTMVRARAIARTLDLEMKIGDVEYQGDLRKATFYYTAEGRVDFRELIRHYAREFKVKIEMRQIGARQESARIGGIGVCGRELCCSTWLTSFKTVTTAAARYQNLAINQAKLSGQCGRLKCCLNYELDTYMEALKHFPEKADTLHLATGKATLVKTDIFKGLMYYAVESDSMRGKLYPLTIDKVKEILAMNERGEKPESLVTLQYIDTELEEENTFDFEDVTGVIDLPIEKRKKKRKKRRKKKKPSGNGNNAAGNTPKANDQQKSNRSSRNKRRRGGRNRNRNKRKNDDKA